MEEEIGDAVLSAGTGDAQSDAVKERLESGDVVMEEEIGDAMLSAGTGDAKSDAVKDRLESGDVVTEEEIGDAMLSAGTGDPQSDAVAERLESGGVVMEEEDYVVREIDVYFIPSPEKTQLHVMQYPLRPSWRRYDFDECLKEIRIKPKSAQIEIDIQHGSSSEREPHSRKQTLYSSASMPSPSICSYGNGVLQGNKLYISSIKAFQQMRPRIELAEDADGKRPVASSRDQGNLLSSRTQNTESEESWIPLKYHNCSSEASTNCLKKLMTAKQSAIPSTVKQLDYYNSFLRNQENYSMDKEMQSLKLLPLEERLKKWLSEGVSQAFKFSVLKYLEPEASDEEFIEVLEKYAVLVQGLWVPKNSTLSLVSEATTNNRATGCKVLARDYVILKFSKNLKFTDKELDSFEKTMRSSLIEALNGLGKHSEILKSWKLKEPADPSFEKGYPSVAMRQKQHLEAHEQEIVSEMKKFLKREGAMRNARFPVEKQEALSKALVLLFKSHSVHSLESICRGLRDMAVSASLQHTVDKNWMIVAASCINSPEDLKCFISEFATIIQGFYVAKSSPTNPDLNPLRNVVIELLQDQSPNGKLKKAQVIQAANLSLKLKVSDYDYLKVMNELCESSSNGWMLKKPN